jgi:hypothetical protein
MSVNTAGDKANDAEIAVLKSEGSGKDTLQKMQRARILRQQVPMAFDAMVHGGYGGPDVSKDIDPIIAPDAFKAKRQAKVAKEYKGVSGK